jgi:hypothetical protein
MAWFAVLLSFDLLLSTSLSSTYQQKTLAIITSIDFLIIFPIFYLGAKYGALGFANAKLIGSGIVGIYHVIVFNKVLNLNLKISQMFSGFLFFLLMFLISTYLDNLTVKLISITIVFATYLLIKESPLRQNLVLLKNILIKMNIIK